MITENTSTRLLTYLVTDDITNFKNEKDQRFGNKIFTSKIGTKIAGNFIEEQNSSYGFSESESI